jgi:spore maturation protein SpmB
VSAYVVTLHALSLMSAGPDTLVSSSTVAQFFTTETSVQVVPKLLQAGKSYFYGVTALTGSVDIKMAPHLVHGAFGASRVLSEQFTR